MYALYHLHYLSIFLCLVFPPPLSPFTPYPFPYHLPLLLSLRLSVFVLLSPSCLLSLSSSPFARSPFLSHLHCNSISLCFSPFVYLCLSSFSLPILVSSCALSSHLLYLVLTLSLPLSPRPILIASPSHLFSPFISLSLVSCLFSNLFFHNYHFLSSSLIFTFNFISSSSLPLSPFVSFPSSLSSLLCLPFHFLPSSLISFSSHLLLLFSPSLSFFVSSSQLSLSSFLSHLHFSSYFLFLLFPFCRLLLPYLPSHLLLPFVTSPSVLHTSFLYRIAICFSISLCLVLSPPLSPFSDSPFVTSFSLYHRTSLLYRVKICYCFSPCLALPPLYLPSRLLPKSFHF